MSTQELHAFSPTGAAVLNTFELCTGTHQVLYFYKDGKRFTHWFGDNHHDDDQETLSFDDQVIYSDENGDLWTAPALTLKTGDGVVIHHGLNIDPIECPNFNQALTLAVKADRLIGETKRLTEKDWNETVNRQGWNETSQVLHLESFIREMGLMTALAAYAVRVAEDENGDLAANP